MTNAAIAAYQEHGNIKKAARHLGISQERTAALLDAAGFPRKRLQFNAARTICFTCKFCRANKCPFMAAVPDKAEAALIAMGAEYETRIYVNRDRRGNVRDIPLFTVLRCPKYQEGGIVG